MKRRMIVTFLVILLLGAVPMTALAAGESGTTLSHVTDLYGLLTQQESASLEQYASTLSRKYDCGLYLLVVRDYQDYAGDTFEFSKQVFENYHLGVGSEKNGMLLMLSMENRDYEILVHGDAAEYAFTEYARDCLEDAALPEFGQNRYYDGFEAFLSTAETALEVAAQGHPLEPQKSFSVLMFLPGVIAAVITYGVLTAQMKSQGVKRDANQYMEGRVNLTDQRDIFVNRTVSRTRKSSDSGSRSSSHGSSHSSGGYSGRSGKF